MKKTLVALAIGLSALTSCKYSPEKEIDLKLAIAKYDREIAPSLGDYLKENGPMDENVASNYVRVRLDPQRNLLEFRGNDYTIWAEAKDDTLNWLRAESRSGAFWRTNTSSEISDKIQNDMYDGLTLVRTLMDSKDTYTHNLDLLEELHGRTKPLTDWK